MASLLSCPLEIQHLILGLLSCTDLYSLNLVNRDLRFLAKPLLYSNIRIKWSMNDIPPIDLLLRTILARDEISSYVCSFTIEDEGSNLSHQYGKTAASRSSERYNKAKAIRIINQTGVPESKWWIEDLKADKMDAKVTLLLSMMSKLTSLHLRTNFDGGTRMLGAMLKFALCQPRQSESGLLDFRKLRHVTCPWSLAKFCPDNFTNNKDFLPFFYGPELESLAVAIGSRPNFIWPVNIPSPSKLTSLELYGLREVRLKPLISVLTNLKELKWNWAFQINVCRTLSRLAIDLDMIPRALFQVRCTLEYLIITADCNCRNVATGYPPPEHLMVRGSLSGFVNLGKLKRLSIPWAFLVGLSPSAKLTRRLGDTIPSCLQYLTLTDDLWYHKPFRYPIFNWHVVTIFSEIRSWLENEKTTLANLRILTLDIATLAVDLGEKERRELEQLGAQAGIVVEVSNRCESSSSTSSS